MLYDYVRVATDGQSADAHVCQHRAAGAGHVSRGTARGAKADRAQRRRVLGQLAAGAALTVTRLDWLARSTFDLLNTLAAIVDRKAGFRSLGDTSTDTTTAHRRLMLTPHQMEDVTGRRDRGEPMRRLLAATRSATARFRDFLHRHNGLDGAIWPTRP